MNVFEDSPDAKDYIETIVASGIITLATYEEVSRFLKQYGDPDLMAGHKPVVAGFDTSLMP